MSVRYGVKHLTTDHNDLSFVETNWVPENLYVDFIRRERLIHLLQANRLYVLHAKQIR